MKLEFLCGIYPATFILVTCKHFYFFLRKWKIGKLKQAVGIEKKVLADFGED